MGWQNLMCDTMEVTRENLLNNVEEKTDSKNCPPVMCTLTYDCPHICTQDMLKRNKRTDDCV